MNAARIRKLKATSIKRWQVLLSVLLSFGVLGHTRADTVYVVDQINIGLHATRQFDSAIVLMIGSGTPLELLERDGNVAKVKTQNGEEGWVDINYVKSNAPLATQLRNATATNEALHAELGDLRRENERLKSDLLDSEENRKRQLDTISRAYEAKLGAAESELSELKVIQSQTATEADSVRDAGEREVARLKAENVGLKNELSVQATSASSTTSATLRDMQRLAKENQGLKRQIAESGAAVRALRTELRVKPTPVIVARQRPADLVETAQETSIHTRALVGFMALLLFAVGAYWHDLSVRRRHGGYRL